MNKGQTFSIYASPKDTVYIKGLAAISITAFLVSRAFILENTMPFGVAFFSAAILNRYKPIPIFLSVVLGIISAAGMAVSYKYITMMGILYIALRFLLKKVPTKRHIMSATTFFIMFSTSMVWLNSIKGYTPLDVLIIGFEAFAGCILMYIFDYAFPVIDNGKKGRDISREQAICTVVVIAVAVSGIGALRIWHVNLKTIVMAVIIIIGAYTHGAALGSAAGALLGLTSGLMTPRAATMVGVFSLAGLLSGTFRELGKIGSALGFIIGSSILNFYISGGAVSIIGMEELLVASLLFMLIPRSVLEYLTSVMDDSENVYNRVPYHIKAKEFALIRLKEFAEVFTQLSATFADVSFKEDFLGIHGLNKLIDGICDKVCQNCNFRKACWERDFYSTYQSVFDLLCTAEEKGWVEIKHIPPALRKRCVKPDHLIETINYLFDLFRINYKWQLKMEDCRNLVSQQLEGMAEVIGNLAGEMDMHLNFNESIERSISKVLTEKGMEILRVAVVEKPGKGSEIYLDKKACYGCRECTKKVIPEISAVTGKRFNKSGYLCSIKKGVCTLKLIEKQRFNVSTGVYSAPKDESEVNGDNYTFMDLKDHQHLIALSDGMGTGASASIESSTAINMLEQLLEIGYSHDMALRTINSIMMLKSTGDSFSTMDIALLDLYNGEAKLVKTGAPPTYIKRGSEVKILASSSLPMGIVDKVDYYSKKISITEGDFIVMVTDGIVEACGRGCSGTINGIHNRTQDGAADGAYDKGHVEIIDEACNKVCYGTTDKIHGGTDGKTQRGTGDKDRDEMCNGVFNRGYNEEWVAEVLRSTDNCNPQEIARIVFERALECYGGQARDDMTVVVSKIWKNI